MKDQIRYSVLVLLLFFMFACSSDAVKEDLAEQGEKDNKDNVETKDVETKEAEELFFVAPPKVEASLQKRMSGHGGIMASDALYQNFNTEDYDRIYENEFLSVIDNPLSTFSIDVDAASYSNVRRFINNSQLPPADAVRIEEMINYFSYDYPEPDGDNPFSINMEVSECPWNEENKLVHIGLQAKKISMENLPPSNIVFLIDVSGSMQSPNKLPLLKSAYKLLTNELRENDKVAIAVYAGAAGLVLPSTSGANKEKIISALEQLYAGGSTAGSAGIKLAYETAKENFIEGGNNRVILATDGDFNIGPSSDSELIRLIEEKREEGIFLTVLGFGMGNYKDSKMEKLADKGNGNYAYIDNILEAKKVLVNEFGGTLFTIAKDVKIQVEFNPAEVKGYRLVGYENRMLNKEDFNDDKKDAGELGSGHTVTALYEVIPPGSDYKFPSVDDLKYQKEKRPDYNYDSGELLTVKFRYKQPDENTSRLIVKVLENDDLDLEETSDNFRFSAAVAEFGMLLRDSKFKANSSFESAKSLAKDSLGEDKFGYRLEFMQLVEKARLLKSVENI
jgi:Ca-activated chloride channel family protein